MQKNILKYISSLILCAYAFTAHAQKKIIESADTIKSPLYYGFTIQGDVASVVTSLLPNSQTYSFEGGVQVDLKHKYYPIVEVGFGGADKTTAENIGFKTDAPFGRIGIDFNLLKTKKNSKRTNNLFLAGVRIGMSNFKYDITNISISNDYWGAKSNKTEMLEYLNTPSKKIWWEFVAGVRVEVVKNIYMGWTIRTKSLMSKDIEGEISPWYIPGFGINRTSNWGFNYSLGYHF